MLLAALAVSFGATVTHAQVVTSRFVSSDPLDNPAAATFRKNRGFFVKANRDEDKTKALNLENSTLGIETTTDVVQTSMLYQASYFFFEANVAYQVGNKKTSSTITTDDVTVDESANTNNNSIKLIPIQLITAFRLGSEGRFGLKIIQAMATNTSKNDFAFNRGIRHDYGRITNSLTNVSEVNTQNNKYTTIGVGGVINLFGTGFNLGIGADYMMLAYDQKLLGDARTTYEGNITETVTNANSRKSLSAIKELYGLSYLHHGQTFSFRSEVNYQKMPPLDSVSSYKIGELTRGMIEATWTKFYGGIEVANKRGYFIDPNNLIPIYFNFAHLTGESAFSYGFFAGFKLSAGNSFGASYYESSEQKKEKLSVTDPIQYSIERKTRSIGLSYSYVF